MLNVSYMVKLEDSCLIIDDRSLIERLIELGAGIEEGGKAKIPLLEAAYFAEKKIIDFDMNKILKQAGKSDPLAYDKYTILKFLRDRGYITRVSLDTDDYFRVHQKGIRPGEDRTEHVMVVVSSDWKTGPLEIKKLLDISGKLRKELIIGYVEKENPHFLKISRKNFD